MTKVWFIGAGPGDPDLLTLAGARQLGRSRTVYVFSPFDRTFGGLLTGKEVCNPFDYRFAELLALLEEQLAVGDVAFLVPGDLTFFCPFQTLIDALGERAEVVPGVGTANAVAAFLKRTLNLSGSCTRTVIVSPRVLEDTAGAPGLAELAAPGVTLIIYMNHLALPDLVAALRAGYGAPVPIVLVNRLGFEGQQVLRGTLDDIVARADEGGMLTGREHKGRSVLTLVIAGETLTAPATSDWWDERCRKAGFGG